MYIKAIATAPGEDTQYKPLTFKEINIRNTEEVIWTTLANDRKAILERLWRDTELRLTDFWGTSDNTMSSEMTTYRQELRDMPELSGFPNVHIRPKKFKEL